MRLEDLFDVSWIEDLGESLNSKFRSASWSIQNGTDVGIGIIGDEKFKLMIDPQVFEFNGRVFNFVNISFAKILGDHETEELQIDSTNASKIIGAITSELDQRIRQYDLDAVVFIAQDHVEKRMRLYNKIARKKWAGLGTIIENIDIGGDRRLTAMISRSLSEHIEDFKAHVARVTK